MIIVMIMLVMLYVTLELDERKYYKEKEARDEANFLEELRVLREEG